MTRMTTTARLRREWPLMSPSRGHTVNSAPRRARWRDRGRLSALPLNMVEKYKQQSAKIIKYSQPVRTDKACFKDPRVHAFCLDKFLVDCSALMELDGFTPLATKKETTTKLDEAFDELTDDQLFLKVLIAKIALLISPSKYLINDILLVAMFAI